MRSCVIFGGAGFVGTHLAQHLLKTQRFDHVHLADIRPSILAGQPGISTSFTDVRKSIPVELINFRPEWIFNLAAVHREPGHIREEYFETNLKGAHNVCAYADAVGCDSIYFTSSISVYGPTTGPTDEFSPIQPSTPYGGSKYPAELIHEMWQRAYPHRRLIISRPGVLYGPGDPGNIMRMIRAIKKGYFAFPGSPGIYKSYGYIYGFLDSIDFTMGINRDFFCYNYVETPTQPLAEVVDVIKRFNGTNALVLPIPLWILLPVSKTIQKILGFRNPIHPVRVKKAATPTHIIPGALMEKGFYFRYTFESSLHHWHKVAPEDFGDMPLKKKHVRRDKITLKRPPEIIEQLTASELKTGNDPAKEKETAR
ncbi:MAG: NAD(P)-dependent oxidoreductase [candidate division Zixibacteria bacterium HGW-Zixibacteria-1]|nr:MAG: NAD(P)-dependent oxidoreductase [candidate division Zixibacteria bacterium HGW-Zixibacteria-1]